MYNTENEIQFLDTVNDTVEHVKDSIRHCSTDVLIAEDVI